MPELALVGVCHVSDLYPNVKYKLDLLERTSGMSCRRFVHDLGSGSLYGSLGKRSRLASLLLCLRMTLGTLGVFLRTLGARPRRVYVAYPAVPLMLLFSMLPGRWRPRLFVDAFISLYDTVVVDRALFSPGSLVARLLYRVERRAFACAERVIVDTAENGAYYAALFELFPGKFVDVALCVPPLTPRQERSVDSGTQEFTCLFVGSLVPLHGIEHILDAAHSLREHREIRFVVIGDGQDGTKLEAFFQEHGDCNLEWERGMFPTEYIVERICASDLCLGIFGTSAKAQRVLPYKIYYYAALGKPFLTASTQCLERICDGEDEATFLCTCTGDQKDNLARRILALAEDREQLVRLGSVSRQLFDTKLSAPAIADRLRTVLS